MPEADQFIVAPGVTPPSAAESTWKPGAFETAASTFPFTDVKDLAQSAVREGIDPYHGRTDKAVFHENKRIDPDIALRCRTQYITDVEKGFSAGPFPSCPYKFARVCWWFYVMKDKNNPADPRIRLISHHSKGDKAGNGSVNSLCASPRLIGVHHSALTIKTLIAMCGKGALVRAWDIPACFKRQRVNARLLHLFVYKVVTLDRVRRGVLRRSEYTVRLDPSRMGMAVHSSCLDVEFFHCPSPADTHCVRGQLLPHSSEDMPN